MNLVEILTPTTLNIFGILTTFGATMAFATRPVSEAVALDWYSRNPTKMNIIIGFFFNIRSYKDVLRIYRGGTFEEIKKNTDANASARGCIWAFVSMLIFITSILSG